MLKRLEVVLRGCVGETAKNIITIINIIIINNIQILLIAICHISLYLPIWQFVEVNIFCAICKYGLISSAKRINCNAVIIPDNVHKLTDV